MNIEDAIKHYKDKIKSCDELIEFCNKNKIVPTQSLAKKEEIMDFIDMLKFLLIESTKKENQLLLDFINGKWESKHDDMMDKNAEILKKYEH